MLWEHEPTGKYFHCLFDSPKLSLRKTKITKKKKENNLFSLIIKRYILFARTIITSAALASPEFLSSFSINLLTFCPGAPGTGYNMNY